MTTASMPEQELACPKCGGKTWDNRLTKRNPKAPDYKCRDRNCDGVIWPPKGGNGAAPAKAPQQKEAYNAGPHIPAIDGPTPPQNGVPMPALDKVFALYSRCLDHVLAVEVPKLMRADIGASPEAVSSMTATLLIQACNKGALT